MSGAKTGFRALSATERIGQFPLRAAEWKGAFSTEQFIERNHRLDRRPFGQRRCRGWALTQADRVVSSMDTLDIGLGVMGSEGEWREVPAVLIASVVTPPEERGHGYASQMIQKFFQEPGFENAVLYSDIGPFFYARFGFHAFPQYVAQGFPSAGTPPPDSAVLSTEDFAVRLGARRREKLKQTGVPGAFLIQDAEFLDWKLERFRYIAEITGRTFPQTVFWSLEHGDGHLLAAFPHFLQSQLDVFWMESGCSPCQLACASLAAQWELSGFRYWVSRRGDPAMKVEWPMLRLPGQGPDAVLCDNQFCDWW